MSHTPGEWKRKGNHLEVFGRGIIAICPLPQEGGVFELQENLCLIASAPDLLAACEAALDEMAGTPLGETVRDMLRAAEAKAKGEEK